MVRHADGSKGSSCSTGPTLNVASKTEDASNESVVSALASGLQQRDACDLPGESWATAFRNDCALPLCSKYASVHLRARTPR